MEKVVLSRFGDKIVFIKNKKLLSFRPHRHFFSELGWGLDLVFCIKEVKHNLIMH